MNRRTIIVRAAAVCSSLLLAGVYVSCKASNGKQAASPGAVQPEPVMPGSKSEVITFPQENRPVMGGSKSMVFDIEPPPPPQQAKPHQQQRP